MTTDDPDELLAQVYAALRDDPNTPDETKGYAMAAVMLIGGLFKDIRRIADAVSDVPMNYTINLPPGVPDDPQARDLFKQVIAIKHIYGRTVAKGVIAATGHKTLSATLQDRASWPKLHESIQKLAVMGTLA